MKMRKMKRPGKIQFGKLTVRKSFLVLGGISWIIGLVGTMHLGVGAFMGIGLIVTTIFHGFVLLSVYRRKQLDRRVVEGNVVTRSARSV